MFWVADADQGLFFYFYEDHGKRFVVQLWSPGDYAYVDWDDKHDALEQVEWDEIVAVGQRWELKDDGTETLVLDWDEEEDLWPGGLSTSILGEFPESTPAAVTRAVQERDASLVANWQAISSALSEAEGQTVSLRLFGSESWMGTFAGFTSSGEMVCLEGKLRNERELEPQRFDVEERNGSKLIRFTQLVGVTVQPKTSRLRRSGSTEALSAGAEWSYGDDWTHPPIPSLDAQVCIACGWHVVLPWRRRCPSCIEHPSGVSHPDFSEDDL